MHTPESVYQEKVDYYTWEIISLRQKMNIMSVLRLLVFLGLAAEVYYLFQKAGWQLYCASFFTLVLFIVLIIVHAGLTEKKNLFEKLLLINSNEIGVLNNKPNFFPDGLFSKSGEIYEDDLDIFGGGSVFHLLNRTTTKPGMDELVGLLKHPMVTKNNIENYQEAIKKLAAHTDKRQLMTAKGLLNDHQAESIDGVSKWLDETNHLHTYPWLKFYCWGMPVLNVGFLYYFLASDHILPFMCSVVFSWISIGFFSIYIMRQHRMLDKQQQVLFQYKAILEVFNTIEITLPAELSSVQHLSGSSCKSINRLAQLLRYFDQRANFVVILFFNSLFLYDLQCMMALENWKIKNKIQFPGWLNALGIIECLNSLATFAFNNPGNIYPVVNDEKQKLIIATTAIAHPLIPEKERVVNDVTIGGDANRFMIITGSNMAGKTTFLRSIGANLLLAQCGAPVCAARFSFTPMYIFSSIRIDDSLQEHTSYFFAELKKLKRIIDAVEKGVPALILIDEILRGTNSDDKTHGSEKFIQKLMPYNCLALIATHDLKLSEMESAFPSVISNYCFESIIKDNDLYFDYKLQKGIAKNRNASFLMERMNII